MVRRRQVDRRVLVQLDLGRVGESGRVLERRTPGPPAAVEGRLHAGAAVVAGLANVLFLLDRDLLCRLLAVREVLGLPVAGIEDLPRVPGARFRGRGCSHTKYSHFGPG